jgi:hypothetical protein
MTSSVSRCRRLRPWDRDSIPADRFWLNVAWVAALDGPGALDPASLLFKRQNNRTRNRVGHTEAAAKVF